MIAELWPCWSCDAPGVRNIGTQGHCARHLAELYRTFDPAVFQLVGVGLPGVSVDDTLLTCCTCGATWHGAAGESCNYCTRTARLQLQMQADLVLTPPDVDPDDINHEPRMNAWADRMRVAALAGIITKDEAARAWRRQVIRHHGAAA